MLERDASGDCDMVVDNDMLEESLSNADRVESSDGLLLARDDVLRSGANDTVAREVRDGDREAEGEEEGELELLEDPGGRAVKTALNVGGAVRDALLSAD